MAASRRALQDTGPTRAAATGTRRGLSVLADELALNRCIQPFWRATAPAGTAVPECVFVTVPFVDIVTNVLSE
ncbi:MAG TPA: hypothetical protein VFW14_00665 [Gaiellales bacterium]|nr:hypothetical protein [Gaiellales bacterium]